MNQLDPNRATYWVAKLLEDYDRCNPDIGWGVSWGTFIDRALKLLDLTQADVNYNALIDKTLTW